MSIDDQIIKTSIPSIINPHLRQETRKTKAATIRALFKQLGLKRISVTAPNYSMAQGIDIRLPDYECLRIDRNNPCSPRCENCKKRHEVRGYLSQIILGAYPDLDDRSDSQSDHFDYCFSIYG